MTELKKSDFYFDLPQELIAQDPLEDRSASRLLVLNRETGAVEHHIFKEITDYLRPGDCLVLNNTKVIPARLLGVKEDTGAAIEILLLKRRDSDVWETLVKPGKKARPGAKIVFGDGCLRAEVMDVVEEGNRLIRFDYEGIFEEVLDRLGEMPLPPYITHKLQDKNRYQTVYAKYEGSAAAAHAGRVLFIKDGCVFHQIYRGGRSRDEMYRMISDALTVIQAQQGSGDEMGASDQA